MSTTTESTTNDQNKNDRPADKNENALKMVSNEVSDSLKSVFTTTNLVYLVLFIAIYLIVAYMFRSSTEPVQISDTKLRLLQFFDIFILAIFIITLALTYFSRGQEEKDILVKQIWRDLNAFVNEPVSLFSLGVFIFVLYLAIYILGIPMDANKPVVIGLTENISWILFVVTLIIVFFNKVLGISITSFIQRMWNSFWNKKSDATSDISGNVVSKSASISSQNEEVFHISNNLYSYDDAQSVCSSFGARLANYDEIEKAYNDGAEWCSYGWSDGQMAFFPTQKETWDKLQKTASHKNDCGRPGVNGGYMANPELHFGVNCYGVKPVATDAELSQLHAKKDMPYAKTEKDIELEQKVKFWRENKDQMMQLASFNNEKWSYY